MTLTLGSRNSPSPTGGGSHFLIASVGPGSQAWVGGLTCLLAFFPTSLWRKQDKRRD